MPISATHSLPASRSLSKMTSSSESTSSSEPSTTFQDLIRHSDSSQKIRYSPPLPSPQPPTPNLGCFPLFFYFFLLASFLILSEICPLKVRPLFCSLICVHISSFLKSFLKTRKLAHFIIILVTLSSIFLKKKAPNPRYPIFCHFPPKIAQNGPFFTKMALFSSYRPLSLSIYSSYLKIDPGILYSSFYSLISLFSISYSSSLYPLFFSFCLIFCTFYHLFFSKNLKNLKNTKNHQKLTKIH